MTKISKSFAVIAGIAIVLGLVFAPVAKAQTSNDAIAALLAQIQSLTAQLNALKAGSTVSTGFTFTANLTVGSTGAEVTALQNKLGVSPATGYFGPITKAAVQAYQAENGISATGYVGPLTRAALNTVVATPTTPGTTVTPTTPGTTVTGDNTDGSLTVSKSSIVSNNAQIKKGETKDMIAAKLQASVGKVAVTRFDAEFNTRPWLYFSSIQLKDSNGNVIAQKSGLSASDFTELTVGSDYLLRFENLNYVVDPSQTQTLTVSGTVLSTTDKLSSNVTVTVTLPTDGIRTINGKGYTDSIGVNGSNTVTLLSTGSNGSVDARIDTNTPAARIQTTSTSGQTNNVELMRFDLKSENRDSTINALNLTLGTSNGTDVSTIFKAVKLAVDGVTYNADTIATTTVFTDLTINLPQDSWKTVVVTGDVADQDDFTNGTIATTTLVVSSLQGVDSNYNTISSSVAGSINTTSDVAGNNITFNKYSVAVSNQSLTIEPINAGTAQPTAANVNLTFTITNNSNDNLFIGSTLATAASTTVTLNGVASTTALTGGTFKTNDSGLAADTADMFQIPSNGSRTLTLQGAIVSKASAATAAVGVKIDKIFYSEDTNNLSKFNISFGLSSLDVSKSF